MAINWNAPIEIRDGRNGNWFWVDKVVWQDKKLTSSDKVVYGTLAYFANNKSQQSFPSYSRLEQYSGVSNRQCYYSVKKLEKLKYVQIRRKSGKPNLYTLLDTPAKIADVQNNTDTPAKEHHLPLQNNTTNKNYINNNYLTRIKSKNTLIRKYSKTQDLEETDFQEIANKYQVPLAFVRSKYDDMVLWAGERPNNPKVKGRNWRLTLMKWVKNDAIKLKKEAMYGRPEKRGIDASNLQTRS